VVQTRFIPPWIMPLSPVPREDQEDVPEMEEASPLLVFSQPCGFPKAGVVDPESSRHGTGSVRMADGTDTLEMISSKSVAATTSAVLCQLSNSHKYDVTKSTTDRIYWKPLWFQLLSPSGNDRTISACNTAIGEIPAWA